eukprot:gene24977-30175_t
MFPGSYAWSSYGADSYSFPSSKVKLLYIPYSYDSPFGWASLSACYLTHNPGPIPVLLATNPKGKFFCIHFHGNACDIGQVAICAARESSALFSHYMLVEYPGYGMSSENSYASEYTINHVAYSVLQFVMKRFQIPHNRIILIGRSIGTGPVCYLASHMQEQGAPPLACVLHSPYSSIHSASSDLLGDCIYTCFLDRFVNHKFLVGDYTNDRRIIQTPVLFIHADGDKVINSLHSTLLHAHRQRCGLPSHLHIQQSTEFIIKGHNYFDYEHDVVQPIHSFIKSLCGDYVHDLQTYPTLILPASALEKFAVPPKAYAQKTDDYYTLLDTKRSNRCYSLQSLGARYGAQTVCGSCCSSPEKFEYSKLRPKDTPRGSIMQVLFRKKSFDRLVNEEEAAKSMAKRASQQHEARAAPSSPAAAAANSSTNSGGSTVNPLFVVDEDSLIPSPKRGSGDLEAIRRRSLQEKSCDFSEIVRENSVDTNERVDAAFAPAIIPGHVYRKSEKKAAGEGGEAGHHEDSAGEEMERVSINYVPG